MLGHPFRGVRLSGTDSEMLSGDWPHEAPGQGSREGRRSRCSLALAPVAALCPGLAVAPVAWPQLQAALRPGGSGGFPHHSGAGSRGRRDTLKRSCCEAARRKSACPPPLSLSLFGFCHTPPPRPPRERSICGPRPAQGQQALPFATDCFSLTEQP